MSKTFSVVIPTYTGVKTIRLCLQSVLDQKLLPSEVVVVIDGPSRELFSIVKSMEPEFLTKKINYRVYRHQTNRGRFEARRSGALKAQNSRILFLDDRCVLSADCTEKAIKKSADIVMAKVESAGEGGTIEATIDLIRRQLNPVSGSYYIDRQNFEKLPKGTGVLLIKKDIFLAACYAFAKDYENKTTKSSSDDTKILRILVDKGYKIFRPSDVVVFYHARASARESIKHLYQRGPKFVDYYFKPGTRFYPHILFIGIVAAGLISGGLFIPWLVTYYAIGAVIFWITVSLYLAGDARSFLQAAGGLPLVAFIFILGVVHGVVKRVM